MKTPTFSITAIALAALAASGLASAQSVKPGTKGTLKVTYEYVSTGQKKDQFQSRQWRVKRTAEITAQLAAEKPMMLSAYRPMEAEQAATEDNRLKRATSAAKKMEPTMEEAMKIVEKCGDDDACVEKAIVAFGTTHQLTEEEKSARGDIEEASKIKDPNRYQIWKGLSQKGTYLVDEFYKGESADPACHKEPNARCHYQETRKGGGEIAPPAGKPNATVVQFETDSKKKEAWVALPIPLSALTYDRDVKTNYPDERDAANKGTVVGFLNKLKPITVAIPAGVKTVSGTETIAVDGDQGERGTLTVKWQFATS